MRDILDINNDIAYFTRLGEELVDKAEAENRQLTPEESKHLDELNKKLADAEAEKVSRENDIKQKQAWKNRGNRGRQSAGTVVPPVQSSDTPTAGRTRIEVPSYVARYGSLKAFKRFNDNERNEADAYAAGMWALAAFYGNYKARNWCGEHGIGYRNDLAEGANTLGGALVPDEFSRAIIDLREEYGVFRRFARVIPMATDSFIMPRRTGGVTAAFIGEAGSMSTSDPTWNNVQLSAKKLYALTKMSTEVNEDAVISLADYLASEFAYAFALKEDQCGFTGDGTSTYGGIVGINTAIIDGTHTASVHDASSADDTFEELDAEDIAGLMAKLPAYALPGAAFYCSQVCKALVFDRLLANAGGNTVMSLQQRIEPNYLGYPIRVSQVMPTSTGDLSDVVMLLFGDLSKSSTFGERRGITVARSDDRYFETDQIALRATERIDIVNHDLGDTTTAGPMVALIGE